MGQAAEVWSELRKLREHKAFYAVVGAADAAAEALRGMPERLTRLQGKVDLAAISGRAVEYVMVAGARVVQAYDELAERGMDLAGRAAPPQAAARGHGASSELPPGPSQDGERRAQAQGAASRSPSAGNRKAGTTSRPGRKPGS